MAISRDNKALGRRWSCETTDFDFDFHSTTRSNWPRPWIIAQWEMTASIFNWAFSAFSSGVSGETDTRWSQTPHWILLLHLHLRHQWYKSETLTMSVRRWFRFKLQGAPTGHAADVSRKVSCSGIVSGWWLQSSLQKLQSFKDAMQFFGQFQYAQTVDDVISRQLKETKRASKYVQIWHPAVTSIPPQKKLPIMGNSTPKRCQEQGCNLMLGWAFKSSQASSV